MNRALLALAAVLAALAVSIPGAFGRTLETATPTATPGVTSSSITIGGTFPLSGPASLYAPIPRGMEAYFNWINSRKGPDGRKGIRGRQIVWKYYDDGYNPAQTVQLTNKLILEDKIFADVGSLGTEHNQAIRPLLNDRKIPQILVATGASYWGLQHKQYPWTIGWQPDYIAEGRAYGLWITKNAANAKIAVFYQNDDYGKDYLRGLKIGLGAKKSLIVSEQSYEATDTSYASQLARQKASGANTWVLLSIPTPTVRALATAKALNWKPDTIVINSVSAIDSVMAAVASRAGPEYVNGAISSGYLKNNNNPKYSNDPIVRRYQALLAQYGPSGADSKNGFYFYGFAKAYDVVKLLYNAGKNPTRASLIKATQSMNWVNPYMIKGIKVKTSKTDHFPISQLKLARYGNGTFSEFGPLIKGR
ncbi:MAG: ABC transporter substrate-binding protein [Actinobacteria bacterium]|nr:ABC transporter substrate-binding protein [Actinomycetota bacterium]